MSEALPAAGYPPGVLRPPFAFSIDVPDHWTVLDLDPTTSDGWVDAFVDQRLAQRDGPTDRAAARHAMRAVVRQLHAEKVFMAAILAAEVGDDLVSASANLAWRQLGTDSDGDIPVAGLREVYARAEPMPGEDFGARRVQVVQLPAGEAVRLSTRQTMAVPGAREPQRLSLTQYFVPVPTTDWLAAITTATPNPPLAAAVAEVAEGMAASLVARPAGGAAGG